MSCGLKIALQGLHAVHDPTAGVWTCFWAGQGKVLSGESSAGSEGLSESKNVAGCISIFYVMLSSKSSWRWLQRWNPSMWRARRMREQLDWCSCRSWKKAYNKIFVQHTWPIWERMDRMLKWGCLLSKWKESLTAINILKFPCFRCMLSKAIKSQKLMTTHVFAVNVWCC